jgi:hypothetical protein
MLLRSICLGLFALALDSSTALSYTSVSGVGGRQPDRLTTGLLLQDADYETTDSLDVEGDLLMAGYKTAIDPRFALGVGGGIMLDGELSQNQSIGDGSGFRFFLDGQYRFKTFEGNQLLGTFGLTHDRFQFEQNNFEVDMSVTDIKVGAMLLRKVRELSLYGGLEAYLYSDGELESGQTDTELEREDTLNLRLGGTFAIDPSFDLRADLYLLGEQSIMIAGDFAM